MSEERIGFIGLGNMGKPMAGHITAAGHAVIAHDIAGTAERAPDGATVAQSNEEVARRASVIVLSLPSVAANQEVVREIAAASSAGSVVVDACTIGVPAAQTNAERLRAAGIGYVDAPVSGMAIRAREGRLTTMCAGSAEAVERVRPVIESYSRNLFHVGAEAGQGQRMKLVNNAICIAQYVLTAEALVYGEAGGLDIPSMLGVINESSGMNFATSFVFPKYVATGRYDDSGSEAQVPCKDIGLFIDGSREEGTPNEATKAAYDTFKAFTDEDPKRDQMWIYRYVKGRAAV